MNKSASMRVAIRICVLSILLACAKNLWADDTDAMLPTSRSVYVHVLMDLGNTELDVSLCTFGVDCRPPFFSSRAHAQLAEMFTAGASVTAPAAFRAVLAAVLEEPALADINVALVVSNHHKNVLRQGDSRAGGGAILKGYQPLSLARRELQQVLADIPLVGGSAVHQFQPRESSLEWLRYIRGESIALGTNTAGNFGLKKPYPNYDSQIHVNGRYVQGIPASQECPRLASIVFTLDAAGDDEHLNEEIAREVSSSAAASFEGWQEAVHGGSVDLLPALNTRIAMEKTWVVSSRQRDSLARRYALATGDPLLYADDPQRLQRELLSKLMGLVTVEAGVSDVSFVAGGPNAAQLLPDVFVTMSAASPGVAWRGNVKKLKLKAKSAITSKLGGKHQFPDVEFVDAEGRPAFEAAGKHQGSVRFDALTFWTDSSTLPSGDGKNIPHNADGRVVWRGGAGQKIDGFVPYHGARGETAPYFIGDRNNDISSAGESARKIFVESETGNSFRPFDADPLTASELSHLLDKGAKFNAEGRVDLIRWARGQSLSTSGASPREWVLGEILHSKPVAINYGATAGYSAANPQVRLFFGSGDGLFHIVENTDTHGDESGRELFAFYPRELLPNIALLRENSLSAAQKVYGVDGAPSVLIHDVNNDGTLESDAGDKAIVYFGLRRGGSSYYALDVSNPANAPKLLWKITRTHGGDFDELGLSFSKPLVGKVVFDGKQMDALIFGGGYAGGWNDNFSKRVGKDSSAADDAVGNALYIVNAHTGELIWKAVRGVTGTRSNQHYEHAGLVDSIPSAVAALHTSAGIIHRIYVGDTGGAVWRVDLSGAPGSTANQRRDDWYITKLADLGADALEPGGNAIHDRRFFHAPELVHSIDSIGEFDGVLIQSGNRAKPNGKAVSNYLFYVKDREIESGSERVRLENGRLDPPGRYAFDDLPKQASCVTANKNAEATCDARALARGWKLPFVGQGEKGLSTVLVDGGRVFASTYVPSNAGMCHTVHANVGTGRLYVLRLIDGGSVMGNARFFDLGSGIPAGVSRAGELLYIPGAGVDGSIFGGANGPRKLIPSTASKLFSLYWREPAIDPL